MPLLAFLGSAALSALGSAYLIFWQPGLSATSLAVLAISIGALGTGLRTSRTALRYLRSRRRIEELTVKEVRFTQWPSFFPDDIQAGRAEIQGTTPAIYGSDILFEEYDDWFKLPTRHLSVGDKTRRVLLVRDGHVWAHRWLDL